MVRVNLKLLDGLHKKLKLKCTQDNSTIQETLVRLIKEYIGKE